LETAPEKTPGHRIVELGPPHMETIGLHMHRLEAEARLAVARTTANSIVAVVEGCGASDVDGTRFEWSRGDVFAVPAWRPAQHTATERSFLLRVTDEPLLKKLNWLRTES
jgi:gentisate 1,2-dioxygenase